MTPSRQTRRHTAFVVAALALLSGSAAAAATVMPADTTTPGVQPPGSPRDSLTATIAGSTIKVNYGRPFKRGRVLFNGLGDMKWGMVWRTGADQATHFTTSKPLMFGSAMVPAGTYTLYTHLVESGKWELVINKQTKQWGTVYDAKQDLVRVPLTVTTNNPVMEQMTITVTPAANGSGTLTIGWDNYRASTNFMVH